MLSLRRKTDWEVTGFNNATAALEAIKVAKPDAVLSDHMMPKMDGAKLLEEVRLISPKSIRLIMSGYVSADKLTLITSAHQYIAKPFEPAQLRDLVGRSFTAQERIIDRGLQQLVTSIKSIPSLPQAHHDLLKALEDDRRAGDSIAQLIGNDPGLSVKVLQLANSAFFGPGHAVTSLKEAVSCLGTEILKAIVLSQSVFRRYESLQHPEVDLKKVWSHCWETGCLAQRLCREKRLPHQAGEEAFLAGLLHEIGRFLLLDNFPDQFQSACEGAAHSHKSLTACMREVLQTTPTEMSAYVLELWGLPGSVINSISHLDEPEQETPPNFSLTSALYIAKHIASKKCPADSFPVEDWKTEYLQSIGCADEVPAWEQRALEAEEANLSRN